MASTPQPWEQREDEAPKAYAAFLSFRDLGPGRTVVEAFRQKLGKPGAKQASGEWNLWARTHEWVPRAVAWDRHQESVRQQATERALEASARKWVKRREETAEQAWSAGRQLLQQATILASMPVVTRTVSEDGRTTVYEAVDPETLRKSAVIAREGAGLSWEAIDRSLGVDAREGTEAHREAARRDDPGTQSVAASRVEAFRAEQRRRMLTMPSGPPGAHEADEDGG